MAKVKEIQVAIESLPYLEYAYLRQWFAEKDWKKWNGQIEADSESGKLDFLIKKQGRSRTFLEILRQFHLSF